MSGFWKTIFIDIILETVKKLLGGKKHGMESTNKKSTGIETGISGNKDQAER